MTEGDVTVNVEIADEICVCVTTKVFVIVTGGGVRTIRVLLSEVEIIVVKVGYGLTKSWIVTAVDAGRTVTKVVRLLCGAGVVAEMEPDNEVDSAEDTVPFVLFVVLFVLYDRH